jgi:hypothetical protein
MQNDGVQENKRKISELINYTLCLFKVSKELEKEFISYSSSPNMKMPTNEAQIFPRAMKPSQFLSKSIPASKPPDTLPKIFRFPVRAKVPSL